MLPGVYIAKKKNGEVYYRSNITYKNKHISLGSFSTEAEANRAYDTAHLLISEDFEVEQLVDSRFSPLSYEKRIVLLNFSKNGIYIRNPIYLRRNFFSYYLSPTEEFKFDIDDLFYYSSHKIIKRGGYLYVNDYGMQYNIMYRYGIHSHSVAGRDYRFINGDNHDFRYSNIEVLNGYHGVFIQEETLERYDVKINIIGEVRVGTYRTAEEAAVAYNKAVDCLHEAGLKKVYPVNYVAELSPKEYACIYADLAFARSFDGYLKKLFV